MDVYVPFREKDICLSLPNDRVIGVLKPSFLSEPSEKAVLAQALSTPLSLPHLSAFLGETRDVLFIVNDSTRPTPTARVLEHVLPLVPPGIKKSFIVACGTHRAPTEEEYEALLGKVVVEDRTNTILYHDARDEENLTLMGWTKDGKEVVINKHVADAKRVVVISSVEPHYFAGFTGGRKSFLPGVAKYDIIERNHALALDPKACTLALEGNPVHEEMDAFARVAAGKKTYGMMTVVDTHGMIAGAACGDLFMSFEDCVKKALDVYTIPLKEKAEVVVTAAPPPMDINLYQSQKALENGKLALKKGGIVILVASCPEGIGPEEFYDLLKSASTPAKVLEKIAEGYKLGYHKAAKIAETQTRAEIWAMTDMEPMLLEAISIRPVTDIQNAVDEALERTGGRVVVLPDGSMTVPLVDGNGHS